MKTSAHIVTSGLLAAALYAHTRSLPGPVACLLSGVLIDVDHLLDFHLFAEEEFTLDGFFSWCHDDRWRKISLLFHSYELYALLFIAAFFIDDEVFHGLLWGTGFHLVLDQIVNSRQHKLSPWFYFLSYRVGVGFRREKLLRTE